MSPSSLPDFPQTLLEFQRILPNEDACALYLERVRWPGGFECRRCGAVDEPWRLQARPHILKCRHCRYQVSLTSGTVMHRSKQPLQVWLWAAYLVTTQTPGMSALQFQRQLGIKRYETAFNMLHKLRAAMVRPDQDRIGAEWPVEVDEVWIGGKTRGEGRGVHHKVLVVGAVEVRERTSEKGRAKIRRRETYAGRMRLQIIADRSTDSLESFVLDAIESGSTVVTDGWDGYNGLSGLGYDHQAHTIAGDMEVVEEFLPIIHLVFGNLQTWLLGTHHGVSAKHLQAYLNEYVFRFNRRFYRMTSFNSVLGIAVQVGGPTYRALYEGKWEYSKSLPEGQDASTG